VTGDATLARILKRIPIDGLQVLKLQDFLKIFFWQFSWKVMMLRERLKNIDSNSRSYEKPRSKLAQKKEKATEVAEICGGDEGT
jgi:hypothetical protein